MFRALEVLFPKAGRAEFSFLNNYRVWTAVTLFNFVIAAIIGFLLRLSFLVELPFFEYMNWLHAHSKLAMMGWVYQGLYIVLVKFFIPPGNPKGTDSYRVYTTLFWLSQIAVIGMLFSFPVQGYGPVSIAFSSAHLILSYIFFLKLWKHLPSWDSIAGKFLRASILLLILSTIAVWALAPIIAIYGKGSILYYMAVQFFLHFQFNGWFVFVLPGIFLHYLEKKNALLPVNKLKWAIYLLLISVFLTFALVVSWFESAPVLFWINSAGSIIQAMAFVLLVIAIATVKDKVFNSVRGFFRFLVIFSFCALGLKVLLQVLTIHPSVALISYTIRNFVVGYIHLITLGMITPFILAFFQKMQVIQLDNGLAKFGMASFLIGIVGSEIIVFGQGVLLWANLGFIPGYHIIVTVITGLLPAGLLMILIPAIFKLKPAHWAIPPMNVNLLSRR